MKNIFLLLVFLFFSCQKERKFSMEGNWQFDTIVSYDKKMGGYSFVANEIAPHFNFSIINDSVINFNGGFFKNLTLKSSYSENPTRLRATYYLGTETNFYLKDSLLIYYDRSINKNDTIKVLKINPNELLISTKDNLVLRLVNKVNKYFDNSKYDAVVINRSPCYGYCPFNYTYLDRDGNFYFKNLGYNTTKSDIATQLNKNKTNKLFKIIDKIDFENLEDNYFLGATDSQTNTISFFKNGKIIKTISTYIKCPIELKEVINELSYACQDIPDEKDYESILGNDETFGFQFNDKDLNLLSSEADFLEVELSRAKKVAVDFESKYEIDPGYYGSEKKYKKIYTDGRYYKFILQDNSSFVIDLEYNFVTKNPILKKDSIF